MCEANAYIYRSGREELLLESVDIVDQREDGSFMLADIFGNQKTFNGKLKLMNLVNHKLIFEP